MSTNDVWYRLEPPLLEVADTTAVVTSIFEWLGETLKELTVDAYSDIQRDDLPPEVARAQDVLRSLRPKGNVGGSWTVTVKPEQQEAWVAAQVYAPWSICCTLIAESGYLGSFDDCGLVSLKLTPEQAASLSETLGVRAAVTRSK